MADVKITPPTIDLAAGGTATFKATDGTGNDLAVTWTMNPPVGAIDPATGGPSASMTYTAPQQISNAQTVTVTATISGGVSASATISLTPAPAVGSTPAPPAMPVGTVSAALQVSITPPSIRLTGGQTVMFQARDSEGKALQVTWKISPAMGTLDPITGAQSTYTAPAQVLSPQAVTVTATPTVGDAATASIFLTLNPVEITPATVELKQTQQQQFKAAVAGDPTNKVTWNISPNIGKIENGLYTAPATFDDSATITIIATTDLWKQTATATLTPPPWTGRGRNALGIYLLAIFLLVFLLVRLWPPSLPDSATAKADLLEAAKNAEERAAAVTKAQEALDAATPAAKTQAQVALSRAQKESDDADHDLDAQRKIEEKVTSPTVEPLWGPISRDIDLMLLVLLAGALGSFLHSARSFADFVGNKRMAGSWAWWYLLHPFSGAIMALVFYAAVRGGFLAITGGANMKASDLSPYGVTAIAALVGMFSNQATQKLADIFDVLFKPSSGKELKNPLEGTTPATQLDGTTSASSSGSSTAPTQAASAPSGPQAKT
jgi:ABC-type cobalt transport system substrate-binding protein